METIKSLREQQGLSRAELARRADMTDDTVRRAEAGQTITRVTAIKICRALGVGIEQITGLKLVE